MPISQSKIIKFVTGLFLFLTEADVDARDNSGRKPKHYIKDSTSPWIQSKISSGLKTASYLACSRLSVVGREKKGERVLPRFFSLVFATESLEQATS